MKPIIQRINVNQIAFFFALVILIDAMASGFFIPMITKMLLFAPSQQNSMNTFKEVVFGSAFIIILSPGYFFTAPIIGSCSDYIGRKNVLLFCLSCSLLGYILAYVSSELNWILLAIFGSFMSSLGSSSFPVVLAALTDISVPPERKKYFSWIMASMIVMIILGIFENYIINLMHNSQTFKTPDAQLPVILAIINLLFVIFIIPETKPAVLSNPILVIQDTLFHLFAAFSKNNVAKLLGILFIVQFCWGLFFQNIYSNLHYIYQYNSAYASIFVGVFSVIELVGNVVIVPLFVLNWSYQRSMLTGLILVGLGLIFLNFHLFFLWPFIACIPLAIGIAILIPILWSSISEKVSYKHQGLIMGMVGSLWALAWMLSDITADLLNIKGFSLPTTTALIIFISLFIYCLLSKNIFNKNV